MGTDDFLEVRQQAAHLLVIRVANGALCSHRLAGINDHQIDTFLFDELKEPQAPTKICNPCRHSLIAI